MLAILGGQPVIQRSDEVHRRYPPVGVAERSWIDRALEAGRLWGPWGEMTRELEQRWARRVGARHCAAVNSGTAALHCAIVGCGVLPGDEVIVPAYTFIGSVSGVMMAGAVPVFADVEPDTGNISAASVEEHLSERTRAIVVVHLHGLPADVGAVRVAAARCGAAVIEDCAQAHGATVDGVPVGGLGDAGAFSLNATKLLAGPEGGLLTTSREDVYNRAARLRVFGVEHRDGRAVVRNTDCIGYSYRTNEIMSAFALARLEAFDDEQVVRRRNARRLADGLRMLPGVQVPVEPDGRLHVYQSFRVRLDPRQAGSHLAPSEFRACVSAALAAEGARWWTWETRALPEYTLFQTKNTAGGGLPWSATRHGAEVSYRAESVPVAVATARDALFTTAHFPPNDEDLMDAYVEAFHKVWSSLHDLARVEPPSAADDEIQDFT